MRTSGSRNIIFFVLLEVCGTLLAHSAADPFPALELPGPLGYDPVITALDRCNREGRNDLGAPSLASDVVEFCARQREVAPRNPTLAARAQSCWSFTPRFTQPQVQANQLYEQARKLPGPSARALITQANTLLEQSRAPLIAQAECINGLILSDEQFVATPKREETPPDEPGQGGTDGGGTGPGRQVLPPPGGNPPPYFGGRPQPVGRDAGPCRPFGRGGYDYCKNPEGTRLPPGCSCQRPPPFQLHAERNVAPGRAPDAPPCSGAESAQLAVLHRTGSEALDTLAAGGSQVDRTLNTFSLTIASAAAQLLNPRAFVSTQIENAGKILGYLAEPTDKFNQRALDEVHKLIDKARQDPAGMLGSIAAQQVLASAGGKVLGGACSVAVKATAPQVARLQNGLATLRKLQQVRDNQPRAAGGTGRLCDSINPEGYTQACFYRGVAQDLRHESPYPHKARDFSLTPDKDLQAPPEYMKVVLADNYGNRSFSTLNDVQNKAQRDGYPVPMTFEEIQQNLSGAGNGARGLLWIQREGHTEGSHVANIGYQDSIHITDTIDQFGHSTGYYDEVLSFVHDRGTTSRFWLYRTAGPDMKKAPP